jgi:hypothetical protein
MADAIGQVFSQMGAGLEPGAPPAITAGDFEATSKQLLGI